MRRIILAAALLMPIATNAEEPAHPVSWFMAHPAEMHRIIPVCQDNAQLSRTATCVNAEAAAAGLRSRNTYVDLNSMLADPRYWSANTIARAAQLAECRAGTATHQSDCRAAAQSALQDIRSGTR